VLTGEASPGGSAATISTPATQATYDLGDAERPSVPLGVRLGSPLSDSGQPRRIETAAVLEPEKTGTVEVRKMNFQSCISVMQKTIDQTDLTEDHVLIVIDTVILRVAKITMDETAVVIACNKHSQKITIEKDTPVSQPVIQ
jgi:hypothetical protein